VGELSGLLVAQGISTAAGIGNTVSQGIAAQGQNAYTQSQARINLGWNQIQQDDVRRAGDLAASRQHQRTNQLIGAQRAAAAASGVDPGVGSALDLQEEASMLGAIDADTIRSNAYRQALGLRAEQAQIMNRARMSGIEARGAMRGSIISGGMQAAQGAAMMGYYSEKYGGMNAPLSAAEQRESDRIRYTPYPG
jgi:hypothetical protein